MLGFTNTQVALAVKKAGGFPFIAGGFDLAPSSSQTTALTSELTLFRSSLSLPATAPLPVGIGFITVRPANFILHLPPILTAHKPAALWLFAPPDRESHAQIIPKMKEVGKEWGMRVFVQVGTVRAAREAVSDGADVVVLQGGDAGGHQFAQGSSVMTLVPEVVDMLAEEFPGSDVQILATGGIMDGRGIAAALILGKPCWK